MQHARSRSFKAPALEGRLFVQRCEWPATPAVARDNIKMKFHLQAPTATLVTGLGRGWIRLGEHEYRENVVLTPDVVVPGWAPAGFAALAPSDFAGLLEYAPELILLGTGAAQQFPDLRLTAGLAAAGIGIDVMDTRAACRTFNILLGEDRRVVAALLIE